MGLNLEEEKNGIVVALVVIKLKGLIVNGGGEKRCRVAEVAMA